MTKIKRGVAVCIAGLLLTLFPAVLWAQDAPASPDEYQQTVIKLLTEQNRKVSGGLRRIQREIAALRADLDKPGMKDVFSGIGYILGLFGAAAFVASRRKE